MPAFVYALLVGLAGVLSQTVFAVLTSLGIGIATFTGINIALEQLHGFAVANWSGLPGNVLQMVGLLRIDQALNLIISAVVIKLTMRGLTSGALKTWVIR